MTAVTEVPTLDAVSRANDGWTVVCRLEDLEPERGVAAMVQGRQVAVFRAWDDALYALDHLDPFSNAYVMARGIVGTRGDVPTVASPMFKQAFDLRNGACLDDAAVRLAAPHVRAAAGVVLVRLAVGGEPS